MPNRRFDQLQRFHPQRQRGVAMLFAIALIVVASLLGVAMMRMLRVEQLGVATEVLSTRALLAADSAAQRALGQLFGGTVTCANLSLASNAMTFTTSGGASITGLDNCNASVVCRSFTTPVTANTYFSIRATGSCGPASDRATRQVEVLARDF
jgi:MSHA biogenesis protein MshP